MDGSWISIEFSKYNIIKLQITNLAHENNNFRDKNIIQNHSSTLEHEVNINSLKDHEKQIENKTLHYPYVHTTLIPHNLTNSS
jgi:hypothetical protein